MQSKPRSLSTLPASASPFCNSCKLIAKLLCSPFILFSFPYTKLSFSASTTFGTELILPSPASVSALPCSRPVLLFPVLPLVLLTTREPLGALFELHHGPGAPKLSSASAIMAIAITSLLFLCRSTNDSIPLLSLLVCSRHAALPPALPIPFHQTHAL